MRFSLTSLNRPACWPHGVDGAGQRAAEAAQVRAAIHGVDVVGEAEDVFRVAVVVLQRDFHGEHAAVRQLALAFEVDRLVVQDGLAAVQCLMNSAMPPL